AQGIVAEQFGERRRHPTYHLHFEPRLLKEILERAEREEPGVRSVENPLSSVIEVSQHEHESGNQKRHVRRADYDLRSLASCRLPQPFHEHFGVMDVFDHIEEKYLIE